MWLVTYEKATALFLAAPHLLDGVGTVVVDEAQMLADVSRGTNLEFLLTLLRVRRGEGIEPPAIWLSAVFCGTGGRQPWSPGPRPLQGPRPTPAGSGGTPAGCSVPWAARARW